MGENICLLIDARDRPEIISEQLYVGCDVMTHLSMMFERPYGQVSNSTEGGPHSRIRIPDDLDLETPIVRQHNVRILW